jgi:hypothetical protein
MVNKNLLHFFFVEVTIFDRRLPKDFHCGHGLPAAQPRAARGRDRHVLPARLVCPILHLCNRTASPTAAPPAGISGSSRVLFRPSATDPTIPSIPTLNLNFFDSSVVATLLCIAWSQTFSYNFQEINYLTRFLLSRRKWMREV